MKKTYLLIGFLLVTCIGVCQNINLESQRTTMYRYPLHPLDKSLKTYSVSIQELGSFLDSFQKDNLIDSAMVLPGYEKVKAGGDIQIELIMNPLSVTSKELKDEPLTSETNGKKIVTHQYWYAIGYNFPTRIRLLAKGEVITEQDLPGFFTTEYYPKNRNSESGIQQEYANDYNFRNSLLGARVRERVPEIRNWLFSNYGHGFSQRLIDVATVKDKKNEYPDISMGFSLMMRAFASTDKKKDYVDDDFVSKLNEAIVLFEKELKQFSPDKKARVNEKVAAMLNYNIALAFYGMHKLDEAENQVALVKDGTRGTQTEAFRLKEDIQDMRLRLVANGLMKGELPPPPPKPAAKPITNSKPETNYKDYIVLSTGDSLYVTFVMPSRDVMQWGDSVWLQDQVIIIEDGKTTEIKARDISSYSYQGVIRETESRVVDSSTIPFKVEYRMCRKTMTGTISLYVCHEIATSMRDPNHKYVQSFPYYKKGNKFQVAVFGNFDRGASRLVSDYPELSARVKNGEFMKDDLEKVIKEYNEWAKK